MSKYFVALDLETTGLNHHTDAIIEFGVLLFLQSGETIAEFSSLCHTTVQSHPQALEVHHIPDALIALARPIHDVTRVITALINPSDVISFVCHNAHFESKFIKSISADASGINPLECWFHKLWLDTMVMSKKLVKLPSNKLSSLALHYEIPFPDSHRALGDCRVIKELFLKLNVLTQRSMSQPINYPVEHILGS